MDGGRMKGGAVLRFKRPEVASLAQVRISRVEDVAVIEYVEPGFWTTHFRLGPTVHEMTDEEILDRFNEHLEAMKQLRLAYKHVAIGIPQGSPQIEYRDRSNQWTPRGGVLRCVVDDGGPNNQPIIHIDDGELSWIEFGRLLTTYAGWGMRIIFVPDDETHIVPRIEVREPRDGE
jgi:hypothetical protein